MASLGRRFSTVENGVGPRPSKGARKPIAQGVRFDVFRRDNFTCVYCGAKSPGATLHCDHVVAVANGGPDDIGNLVTACSDCNYGKGAKVLKSSNQRSGTLMPKSDNALPGLYGHSRDENGEINWQFQITGMVGNEKCAIQLFSWLDGRPTKIVFVAVSELVTDRYSLYSSRDEWLWQHARESAVADGKGDAWARETFALETGRDYDETAPRDRRRYRAIRSAA